MVELGFRSSAAHHPKGWAATPQQPTPPTKHPPVTSLTSLARSTL
jgi:hypothetical protein